MHAFLGTGAFLSATNSQLAGVMYAISHVFLFLSIAIFLRVPLRFVLPKKEKVIFYTAFSFAILASVLLFGNLPLPEATVDGLTKWNIPDSIAGITATFTTIMLALGFVLFIISGRRARDIVYKKRAYFLAFGILVFLIAGPAHNFAETFGAKLFADSLTPVGALLMFYGIYYPRLVKKEEETEGEEEPKEEL